MPKTVESLITPAVAKSIQNQDWPLVKRTSNEKGKCIIAMHPIKAGTIVADYHGSLLDFATRHKRYLSNDSENNRYMYCFSHGSKRYYVDANNGGSHCHPKKELKGRLVNHGSGKAANLKTRVDVLNDTPVLLLQATRDISPLEELLFDYNCKGDSLSDHEPWMT